MLIDCSALVIAQRDFVSIKMDIHFARIVFEKGKLGKGNDDSIHFEPVSYPNEHPSGAQFDVGMILRESTTKKLLYFARGIGNYKPL